MWKGIFQRIQLENAHKYINSVHNGQKDYKCDSCGKALSRAQSLKIHINSVHKGKKDHKCNICGMAFSTVGCLKRHINAFHNRQQNYRCAISQAINLSGHINAVHNGQKISMMNKSNPKV